MINRKKNFAPPAGAGRFFFLIPVLLLAWIFSLSACGQSTESLIQDLKDSDPNVRMEAANALGNTGEASAAEPLINSLKDSDIHVRVAAAGALGRLGNPDAVLPLIGNLVADKDDSSGAVQKAAAAALGKIGDPRAIAPLVAALDSVGGSFDAKNQIKESLVALSPAAIPFLIAALEKSASVDNVDVLVKIGSPSVDPLLAALKSGNPIARINVIDALAKIKDTRAVQPLAEVLSADDNPRVRANAASALADIGDTQSVQPLIAALSDTASQVRWQAAASLAAMEPAATSALMDGLNNHNLEVVARAYPFFIKKGGAGTEPILIEALNNYGNETMGEDYLNCGNKQLEDAAVAWGNSQGYYTMTNPIAIPSSGALWGSS